MKTLPLVVPPFSASLMSMVAAVARYDGLPHSDAYLFGATGHAFLMNVQPELCPSGPYCFDRSRFYALARGIGIGVVDHGCFMTDASPGARAEVETILRDALDRGRPAGLVNMEYQAISGYDATGFVAINPWPCSDGPAVTHLTFGTWAEFDPEVHVNFFTFEPSPVRSMPEVVDAALRYALELWDAPFTGGYATGRAAYRVWREAIPVHGGGHGNWWNAMVWRESRERAAEFLEEVGPRLGEPALLAAAAEYRTVAEAMAPLTEREAPADAKLAALQAAESAESRGIARIAEVISSAPRHG